MPYNNAHYGPGIRGLGVTYGPTLQQLGVDQWLDSSGQTPEDWGYFGNSPAPGAVTNQSGTANKNVGVTQFVTQNSGMITLLAVGLLALVVLKK